MPVPPLASIQTASARSLLGTGARWAGPHRDRRGRKTYITHESLARQGQFQAPSRGLDRSMVTREAVKCGRIWE